MADSTCLQALTKLRWFHHFLLNYHKKALMFGLLKWEERDRVVAAHWNLFARSPH